MHSRKSRRLQNGTPRIRKRSPTDLKSNQSSALRHLSGAQTSTTHKISHVTTTTRNHSTLSAPIKKTNMTSIAQRVTISSSLSSNDNSFSQLSTLRRPNIHDVAMSTKMSESGISTMAQPVKSSPNDMLNTHRLTSASVSSNVVLIRPKTNPLANLRRLFSSSLPSSPATPRVPVDKINQIPIDPSKIDPNKKFQHYGVKALGPEQWTRLCTIASENLNKYMDITKTKDTRASGLDPVNQVYRLEKISPQDIHELYRDLSHIPAHLRHQRIIDLYLICTKFLREPDGLERDSKGGGGGAGGVTAWLMFLQALVFIMVLVGGLTRLTKSGLSMTHWKFFGEDRPKTDEDWEREFALYKESPEYKLHNTDMTLDEFKFIYHMEYGHRTLGRFIGVAFTIPFAYFLARGKIKGTSPFGKKLLATLSLGGVQGLIGWWMVKSGLDEEKNKHKANVSPYRLATHLITAFALLTGLNVLTLQAKYGKINTFLDGKVLPKLNYMGMYIPRKLAHSLAGMTFLTAASGAFVAGNDAGKVYNEFPLMGGQLVPSDIVSPYIKPAYKNIFENQTTVQFIHRCMAMSTLGLSYFTAAKCGLKPNTPANIKRAAFTTALVATAQAGLGISTLLTGVPVDLATAHQGGAMLLLLSASRLMYLSNNPALGLGKKLVDELGYRQGLIDTVISQQSAYTAKKMKSSADAVVSAATKTATSTVNKSSAAVAAVLGASTLRDYVEKTKVMEAATDLKQITI